MNKIQERVEALLAKMTLEEKAAQMIQIPYSVLGREESLKWARRGAGSFLHVLGDNAREVQRAAMETRLGIPVIFGIDAIHGHGLNPGATIFPSQLATACSWNPEAARKVGEVTAREVATDGLHWTFSPVLCLGRDLRWGRVDETFGEDPFLAGEMGAAIIRGYQGDDLTGDESILACAKHYLAYGEATGARDACDSSITWRRAKETFIPPFRRAVEAGCGSFMTAYGSIDGTPFTVSHKALTEVLREDLGFDGFVVTDWDNVRSLITNQHVAADMGEASRLSAEAGNDMIMTTDAFYDAILAEIRAGRLPEDALDNAVRHILTVKFRMGLFEKPEKKGRPGCIGCEAHHRAALEAARETVTVLRNSGMLPLDGSRVRKVAVIGPNADSIRGQYGDWTYFTHPDPTRPHDPVRPYETVWEGMRAVSEAHGAEAFYAEGCDVFPGEGDDIDAAVKVAQGCDAIILVVGDRVEQHGEYKDRANLDLSGRQTELFRALRKLGKPLATVLVASKPLTLPEVAEGSDAFVCAFNGGQFGGRAVAEILWGDVNPVGRLPISFARHVGQLPVHYTALPGWHGGKYMDLPAEPLFTFGEGLGYTTFAFSDLRFDPETLRAEITVSNTGSRPGRETVQVYFRDLVCRILTPVKRLIAFRQVDLAPGESKTVRFDLKREDFSYVNPEEERVTDPGEFELMIGHSARDEDLQRVTFAL